MSINGYCGKKKCEECGECSLYETIPCSPDCKNLTEDGRIIIKGCLESKYCDEVRYIFDMVGRSDEDIIREYGKIGIYPYGV